MGIIRIEHLVEIGSLSVVSMTLSHLLGAEPNVVLAVGLFFVGFYVAGHFYKRNWLPANYPGYIASPTQSMLVAIPQMIATLTFLAGLQFERLAPIWFAGVCVWWLAVLVHLFVDGNVRQEAKMRVELAKRMEVENEAQDIGKTVVDFMAGVEEINQRSLASSDNSLQDEIQTIRGNLITAVINARPTIIGIEEESFPFKSVVDVDPLLALDDYMVSMDLEAVYQRAIVDGLIGRINLEPFPTGQILRVIHNARVEASVSKKSDDAFRGNRGPVGVFINPIASEQSIRQTIRRTRSACKKGDKIVFMTSFIYETSKEIIKNEIAEIRNENPSLDIHYLEIPRHLHVSANYPPSLYIDSLWRDRKFNEMLLKNGEATFYVMSGIDLESKDIDAESLNIFCLNEFGNILPYAHKILDSINWNDLYRRVIDSAA